MAAPQGSDWPRWRGAGFDGKAGQQEVFPRGESNLRVAWTVDLGTGYSAISVAQGKAVTLFSDAGSDWVGALDADDGGLLWRYRIDDFYPGQDGARDGPTATPLIHDGQVFALGPRGLLLSLDLEKGSLLWSVDLSEEFKARTPHWGFTTSPLIHKDLLIVAAGGSEGSLCAFDRRTGARRWTFGTETVEYQSPILIDLAGLRQVVYAGQETLFGVDPDSGRELWSFRHQGAGFYQRIINPVAVGDDKLFLLLDRTTDALLRIVRKDDKLHAEKLWTSQHLKRNYNVPIHHEGYLYGYSGDFLVCVDAADGELVWKSRPPGNGFLGFADGQLVIMDREGGLHVAPASPRGYQETARLDLFGKESWTPPSIASGRIYVRSSFGAMAAVEVVAAPSPGAEAAADVNSQLVIADSSFQRFVEQVEASAQKEKLLDEFMLRQARFPILEGERRVHFVYRGPAKAMALGGDLLEGRRKAAMNRILGTDFWYASFEVEPGTMLSYFFERDLEERMVDPLNPLHMTGPVVFGGEVSLLLMAGRSLPADLDPAPEGSRGRLVKRTLQRGESSREIQVYLPPGYELGTRRFPTLYVHYGDQALEVGRMDHLLDNLIAAGRIRPLIAVFVPPATAYEYARSQVDEYSRFLVEQLIPEIDRHYRTIPEPPSRGIMGGDEGGFGAFYAAFRHPRVFGRVSAHSPLKIGYGDRELWKLMARSGDYRVEAYLDWGRYDFRDPSTEETVSIFSRELSRRLREGGHRLKGGEHPDGAGFPAWRGRTRLLLEALFPTP